MLGAQPRKRAMVTLTTFKSLEQNENLFDFDTPINEDNFIINQTSLVYRKKSDDQARFRNMAVVSKGKAMNGDMPDFDFSKLFGLSVTHDQKEVDYSLDKPEGMTDRQEQLFTSRELSSMPFICLNNSGRRNEVKSSIITEGDVIKLGNVFFRVAESHLSQAPLARLPQVNETIHLPIIEEEDPTRAIAKTCRICLMEDDEEMISPCKCKGSCKHVHLECLTTWLQNKVTRQENRLVSAYYLSKFQCELCKTPLPNRLTVGDREVNFVEFRKPDEPYLLLEKIQQNARQKTLYMITPRDQPVRIGRGNYADIRIHDLTISRLHCQIEFKAGEFHLTDLGSKFGSLLLLQDQKAFSESLCLQMSNKIYKLEVVPSVHPRTYAYL